MESIFNSPVMVKLQEFGQKLGQNKFLSSLQAAMMSLMGIVMIGAISQIIVSIGSTMLNLFAADSQIYAILYTPYNFTTNMLGLWVVVLLTYNYARALEVKTPIISTIEALICFLISAGAITPDANGAALYPVSYLGASGMFIGFLVSYVVVRIDKVCIDKKIYIRMPDVVPQFLQDGFASIVPLLFNVVIFLGIDSAIFFATGGTLRLASGFLALLSAPLSAMTSIPGMFFICFLAGLMWCFGIHGSMIIMPIIMPLALEATTANAAAYAAGGVEALAFYPVMLMAGLSGCGGTGNTLPAAIYGSFLAKSRQMKAVGKAALIPGWFNINEPIAFGMPVMYNPVLCIPYVLSIPINMCFYWIGYATGLVIPSFIPITAVLPLGFVGYLGSLNIMNAVWDYLSIIPMSLVWFPFLKVYDRQLLKQEAEAEALEGAE